MLATQPPQGVGRRSKGIEAFPFGEGGTAKAVTEEGGKAAKTFPTPPLGALPKGKSATVPFDRRKARKPKREKGDPFLRVPKGTRNGLLMIA